MAIFKWINQANSAYWKVSWWSLASSAYKAQLCLKGSSMTSPVLNLTASYGKIKESFFHFWSTNIYWDPTKYQSLCEELYMNALSSFVVIILILEMTKLGLKEVKWLTQSLTAGKRQSLDLHSDLSLPQALPLLFYGIPGILFPSSNYFMAQIYQKAWIC